jgi:hypothetical protein
VNQCPKKASAVLASATRGVRALPMSSAWTSTEKEKPALPSPSPHGHGTALPYNRFGTPDPPHCLTISFVFSEAYIVLDQLKLRLVHVEQRADMSWATRYLLHAHARRNESTPTTL